MEATAGGLTTGTLGALTVVHGAASQIALTGATTNLTSGATRVPHRDDPGRRRQHRHLRQHTVVDFAKQSGAGTVTGTGTATAASGVAAKTVTGQLVGAVVMEATSGSTTLGSFTVVHGAAAQIAIRDESSNRT